MQTSLKTHMVISQQIYPFRNFKKVIDHKELLAIGCKYKQIIKSLNF
jgi:hypothetical protein